MTDHTPTLRELADDLVGPAHHLFRQRIARRYDTDYAAAHEEDSARRFLQAFYCHARAEALADAMVDLLSDMPQRNTWRIRAAYHNRSCEALVKAMGHEAGEVFPIPTPGDEVAQ